MGASPSHDVLGTLYHHALESHIGNDGAYLVVVDERTVAEHLGCVSKEFLHLTHLPLGLVDEAFCIDQ